MRAGWGLQRKQLREAKGSKRRRGGADGARGVVRDGDLLADSPRLLHLQAKRRKTLREARSQRAEVAGAQG